MFLDNSYAIIYIMEPTDRSNVGNSLGGQNLPPVNTAPQPMPTAQPVQQPGYDPIFSPTGRADVQSVPTTPTIISGPATPAPDPNHTASTATGDIVLQKSPAPSQTKSKLPLIIAAIAAILVVGAGIFILVANPFANNSNNSTNTSTVASFNKFINYLYDGSTATGYNADAYVDNASYKFEEMLNSNDQTARTKYFNVAQGLLNDFNNNLQNNNITDTQQGHLDSLNQNLNIISQITSIAPLTNEAVAEYYLQNTAARTKQYLQSHYSTLLNSNINEVKTYAQNSINYQSWLVDYLAYLSDNKCLSGNNIDTTCAENLGLPEAMQQQKDSLSASFASSTTITYTAAANIIDQSTQMATTLGLVNTETSTGEQA